MSEVVVFEPETFVYTKEKARQQVWLNLLAGVVFCAIFFGLALLDSWRVPGPLVGTVSLSLVFPFVNRIFSRFPTRVVVDKTNRCVDVDYLDGRGRPRRDRIRLEGAMIRYTRKSRGPAMQVRITQNIINNWIFIDYSHGFTEEQVKEIYDTAMVALVGYVNKDWSM